jgi:NADPH-dependent 2,4-dienoyl-CoA reductase/sulfur reductase-like enzyme
VTQRLVVVGGDAAGMAAASVARRRWPELEIVAFERGPWTSYSACGIPYLVSGEVKAIDDLVARTPDEFRARGIDMRTEHEVTGIDLDARKVTVHDRRHDRTFRLGFDLMQIGTGALPNRPDIPGLDREHVHGVQNLVDAARLLADAEQRRPDRVVVIGGGYIGLELAEAFVRRGAAVTVVDRSAQVLGALDPDLGAVVGDSMRKLGITVRLGETVRAVEPDAVITDNGPIPADLVILGLGVRPDSALAAEAGIETGVHGAIVVDRRQRTSAEGVWAAGDCCQSMHLVSGAPTYEPLGTVANKQARVAGINLSGGYATFPGVVGTAITRLCDLEIACTGLNQAQATAAGFRFEVATIETTTIAGYMPGSGPITVRVLAERGSGRLLGGQILGASGSAKRIDVLATALSARMNVEDILMLDLAYAPPYASVWDPVQAAAREALAALSAPDRGTSGRSGPARAR